MKTKNTIKTYAVVTIIALILLFVKDHFNGKDKLILDTLVSCATIIFLYKYYKNFNLTKLSFVLVCIAFLMHNLDIYDKYFWILKFDNYMHFVGGFAVTSVFDRLMFEKMPTAKRYFFLVMLTLGIGSVYEMMEYSGYLFLGNGPGMFYYGLGDEGQWNNAIKDLCFNSLGAIFYCVFRSLFPKYFSASS